MEKWNLKQNQPLVYFANFLPIISFKKGKSWQRTCLLEPSIKSQPQAAQAQYESYFINTCGFILRNP